MAEDLIPSEISAQLQSVSVSEWREVVDDRLGRLVPAGKGPADAARHSLLLPGKRLRALLTLAAAKDAGGDLAAAMDPACAVEMVHTASLVFDDLPSMDDADLRRGATTPHVLYGEDVAILAGIGLLNGAFGVIASAPGLSAVQRCRLVQVLSDAVGWAGLVDGQALDLSSEDDDADAALVAEIHHGKTGALFVAATVAGVVVADADPGWVLSMTQLGYQLGQAYQAFDDVLDAVASSEAAGKPTQADRTKATAVSSAHRPEVAVRRAREHLNAARDAAPANGALAELLNDIEAHFDRIIAPAMSAA